MMAWYLFLGDMLVMLFMVVVVVWVSLHSTRQSLDAAARIPLEDERIDE
jgi:cbb3-type cytochrome oxidase subunit 3